MKPSIPPLTPAQHRLLRALGPPSSPLSLRDAASAISIRYNSARTVLATIYQRLRSAKVLYQGKVIRDQDSLRRWYRQQDRSKPKPKPKP